MTKKIYHLLDLEILSTDHMASFLTITQFQPVISHAMVNLSGVIRCDLTQNPIIQLLLTLSDFLDAINFVSQILITKHLKSIIVIQGRLFIFKEYLFFQRNNILPLPLCLAVKNGLI